MKSLSKQYKNKSAKRGAQFVPIGENRLLAIPEDWKNKSIELMYRETFRAATRHNHKDSDIYKGQLREGAICTHRHKLNASNPG